VSESSGVRCCCCDASPRETLLRGERPGGWAGGSVLRLVLLLCERVFWGEALLLRCLTPGRPSKGEKGRVVGAGGLVLRLVLLLCE
jgi:hypothetical protein